jgi:hypothetical protein
MGANGMPPPRGPVSAGLVEMLAAEPGAVTRRGADHRVALASAAEPYGDDLQLALYLCYELHYRGIEGVSDAWEWDPELLELRGVLERNFLRALRRDVPVHADIASAVAELLIEPTDGAGVPGFLRDEGETWQLREYAALRSLYQLKEADPHAWAIPRLTGRAKAALVAVEYDEFGAGRAERIHAELFAALMTDLQLDNAYGRYTHAGTAEMFALVNLMSLFGLHRSSRGALVGHFATVEATSSPASRRIVSAMRRLGVGAAAVRFYAEHVAADAVHEQLVRREVIGGVLADEPALEPDVVFGVDATVWLENRFGDQLLKAWRAGRSSLAAPV